MIVHLSKRGAAARGMAQQMALKAGLVSGGGNKVVNTKMITDSSIKNAIEESRRLRRGYGPDIIKNAPLADVDLFG